ncbi:MAG: HlyD family efflux transporter periplasmic adaptor subunit [Rhodospirillaceae bacterium]|nr:HlyD family efflux transporter periplasmic adaptor subunit [Rhodospirillaceae bacterium]
MGYAQLILILAAIGVALYFAQAPSGVDRDPISDLAIDQAKPTVAVIQPAPTEQALRVDLTGGVTLHGNVKVSSEVGGRVVWVSPDFRNGGSIAANETFIRIDPTEYELELEVAAARVARADARLQIERVEAEEAAASFARENPGADIPERVRRAPHIAKAEASLMKAQAKMKLAQLQLDRTEISLPYDIRVAAADIDVGQFVGPAELVGRASSFGSVYRTDALQVRAPIEQDSLAYLAPAIGRSATVRTAAGTYEAHVERTSAGIGPKTRLATLFLKFAEGQPADTLPLPGTFAEVSIAGPVHDNVYLLPESAMQERGSVWVVDGGALKAVAPQMLGHADGGVVVEAFDVGDGIVVGSLPGAREGLAVEVSDAPASE